MKVKHLLLAALMTLGAAAAFAADATYVNLTPKPKSMTVGEGSLALPTQFSIQATALSPEMNAEITRFAADLKAATGIDAAAADAPALITVTANESVAPEGYNLNITPEGVTVEASTPVGLYFAFQSVKKILPANVMAGVFEAGTYELPVVDIKDEPRYEYRGFMLDVARHFFTVDEVKRMIDVMSYYKLNTFHWHLTDDQGWRIEIPQYPKLTTVGATAPNRRYTDMYSKTQYWINKPYGPYFYTQDELRDVVAYAAERHIEVIPEVDMPGHFAAPMTAYPEFSCTPNGGHTVWSDGGISSDVLNVVNPGAVKFAKDVLDVLMDVFPSETIHIGGDECPTSAWEQNAECQAYYQENKLTNYRQLQSHFIKEMSDYVQARGRKLALWNEAITAGSADRDIVKETGSTIYCWTGPDNAAKIGTELGLKCIYTPWGPYYINRLQQAGDPPAAGNGGDDVKATYNTTPFSTVGARYKDNCYGVQGTFWCEHVSDREYMEWLALPRLIAVAEAGWTPQAKKNFEDFRIRMSADRKLLDYGGYKYSPHHMLEEQGGDTPDTPDDPVASNLPDPTKWYRLVTKATNAGRQDLCVELLMESSAAVTSHTGNAQVDRLWSAAQVEEGAPNYDYQWWQFREDPKNPGHFAWINKAKPNGSVNGVPTAEANAGRWDYEDGEIYYDFVFDVDNASHFGTDADGNHWYAFRSTEVSNGNWVNMAAGGQQLSINVYGNPNDGDGGLFTFVPQTSESSGEPVEPTSVFFEEGKSYFIENVAEGFEGFRLADNEDGLLAVSDKMLGNTVWDVESVTTRSSGAQSVKLVNQYTKSGPTGVGSEVTRLGKAVNVGETSIKSLTATASEYVDGAMTLALTSNILWPVPADGATAPSTVRAGSTANGISPRMGSVWKVREIKHLGVEVKQESGTLVGLGNVPVALGETIERTAVDRLMTEFAPDFEVVDFSATADSLKITVRRVSRIYIVAGQLENGLYLFNDRVYLPLDADPAECLPEVPGCKLEEVSHSPETRTVIGYYSTTASRMGVKKILAEVTEISDEDLLVIHDNNVANDRDCYRMEADDNKVYGSKQSEHLGPNFIWQFEADGEKFAVRNYATGRYIQATPHGTVTSTGTDPYPFTFTYQTDHFQVKGGNGQCWDGNGGDFALVGWSAPGHPYQFYTFLAEPMFTVTVNHVDHEDTALSSAEYYCSPGETHVLYLPYKSGYDITDIRGAEGLQSVDADCTVTVVYTSRDISAIDAVLAPEGPSAIYDLHGRRLSRISAPGVYIVNGAKLLVR